MKLTFLIFATGIFSGDAFLPPTSNILGARHHRDFSNFMVSDQEASPHSSRYLGEESRDYWWNHDFLNLMSKRWEISEAEEVLDVGCGVGHWGRSLSSILPNNCKITGIDKEPCWIDQAIKISQREGTTNKLLYCVGDAYNIPFSNETFDVVTCQTLLIHLPDVNRAILEMLRVLKPRGKIIAAEPNNLANSLFFTSHDIGEMEEKFEIAKFQYICEKGKMSIGEGFNSLGDLLPGIFSAIGIEGIKVFIADKTLSLIPPYGSREEESYIEQLEESVKENYWIWSKKETQRYFLAGGGADKDFEKLWMKAISREKKIFKGIKKKTLHTAGGNVMYCVSGVKK